MNEFAWYLSRATGAVSLILLTVVLVLGVVSTSSERPRRTTIANAVHRSLGLGLGVFLLTHIVTAIIETYVSIDWISAIVPFTSGYQPLWVGLGTVAFDLLLALIVTSVLRHRLPESVWRFVHQSSWALWLLAVVHAVMLETTSLWLQASTVGCLVTGLAAAAYWLATTTSDARRRRDVLAKGWS